MQHSKVVGGSTAGRVLNCPGSVALVAKMPPQQGSKYAEEGTLLHACMEVLLDHADLERVIERYSLTDTQAGKLQFCLDALDEIDPDKKMTFAQEVQVGFDGIDALAGVFGHVDLIGRLGNRVIGLDWKFGDGVAVDAEENDQGLFYMAAALKTRSTAWAFDGATEVEIIVVQPPVMRRWVTTFERIQRFEQDLINAVLLSREPDAPLSVGDWCRWCPAKPVCPQMTGAVDRAVHTALRAISDEDLGRALTLADRLEDFIKDARALAQARLEKGMPVSGWKLVPKKAQRQWVKPDDAAAWLTQQGLQAYKQELLSPAQAETALKKSKTKLPADLVVSVSSGNTIAAESDPRPAVLVIGEQLKAALARVK